MTENRFDVRVPNENSPPPQTSLSFYLDAKGQNMKTDVFSLVQSRDRLNDQVNKFESDITNLQEQIEREGAVLGELEAAVLYRQQRRGGTTAAAGKTTATEEAEAHMSKEDAVLQSLDAVVTRVHDDTVGESRSPLTTMEKLKRVELRMELLTKELDLLPQDKVKVAQRTCEKERRHREDEAKLEQHRQQHAARNKRALNRALAPPFVKPELRRFLPPKDILEQRRRRLYILRKRIEREEEEEGWRQQEEAEAAADIDAPGGGGGGGGDAPY